jgi:KipI family sensor histidine kinase inhibitor
VTERTARILEAGDSAVLLELEPVIDAEVNARAIRIAAAVRDACILGVRDVISTYRSVGVFFDPLSTDVSIVVHVLRQALRAPARHVDARTVEVSVSYGGEGGPDLEAVAARAGISIQDVIDRHTSAQYRVFMLGFLPGFAYMGGVHPSIASPRRATPRGRVAAGSVGIAGEQTGIYPRESPGGWQIIGRTDEDVFDPSRTPASLFAPGDIVRFVADAINRGPQGPALQRTQGGADLHGPAESPVQYESPRRVTVLRPGLFTTIQDLGRWGHQSVGVPVAGPMDAVSHRRANLIVGNPGNAAALEATVIGPELQMESEALVAIAGADLGATLNGTPLPLNMAVRCAAGSVIKCGERRRGARAYIAFDGGIATPPVLGSRATHVLSGLGGFEGRALRAGDGIPLQPTGRFRQRPPQLAPPPVATGGARLRVLPGPQDDFFNPVAIEALQRNRFTITSQSDRMGYRLAGRERIARASDREMISDATFVGAVQIPASGEPILLMADRQTTGGYPQIATVITADLPLAGQLAPGDWVEFQLCTRSEAIAALVAQEAALLAFA